MNIPDAPNLYLRPIYSTHLDSTEKTLKDLPPVYNECDVTGTINNHIERINSYVKDYIKEAESSKEQFVEDVKATHEYLTEAINEYFEGNVSSIFEVSLLGPLFNNVRSEPYERDIHFYNNYCYGKQVAVDQFMKALYDKGWKPKITTDKTLDGLEYIIISCDFTHERVN